MNLLSLISDMPNRDGELDTTLGRYPYPEPDYMPSYIPQIPNPRIYNPHIPRRMRIPRRMPSLPPPIYWGPNPPEPIESRPPREPLPFPPRIPWSEPPIDWGPNPPVDWIPRPPKIPRFEPPIDWGPSKSKPPRGHSPYDAIIHDALMKVANKIMSMPQSMHLRDDTVISDALIKAANRLMRILQRTSSPRTPIGSPPALPFYPGEDTRRAGEIEPIPMPIESKPPREPFPYDAIIHDALLGGALGSQYTQGPFSNSMLAGYAPSLLSNYLNLIPGISLLGLLSSMPDRSNWWGGAFPNFF